MTKSELEEQLSIDANLVWNGFIESLPVALSVIVFGAAFGLAATDVGISNVSAIAMSASVFAGYAQFAVLEQWGSSMSVAALAMTVFVINARHVLMGASLHPWLQQIPVVKRYSLLLLVSDANWAMSLQAFQRGQPGFGLLLGGGIALWICWVIGTVLGAAFGSLVIEPSKYGLDLIMGCFLVSIVLNGRRDLRVASHWVVSALVSIFVYLQFSENFHVVAAAIAGGVVSLMWRKLND